MYACDNCDNKFPRMSVKKHVKEFLDAFPGDVMLDHEKENDEVLKEVQFGFRTDVQCPSCHNGLLWDKSAHQPGGDADLSPDGGSMTSQANKM